MTLLSALNACLNNYIENGKRSNTRVISLHQYIGSFLKNPEYEKTLQGLFNKKNVDIYTFSNDNVLVPNRRGFALIDAIDKSQEHRGTYLWKSVSIASDKDYNRIIVITDEQSYDSPVQAKNNNCYIVNVSTYNKGVGYEYGYKHINGFSDKIFDYIFEIEKNM